MFLSPSSKNAQKTVISLCFGSRSKFPGGSFFHDGAVWGGRKHSSRKQSWLGLALAKPGEDRESQSLCPRRPLDHPFGAVSKINYFKKYWRTSLRFRGRVRHCGPETYTIWVTSLRERLWKYLIFAKFPKRQLCEHTFLRPLRKKSPRSLSFVSFTVNQMLFGLLLLLFFSGQVRTLKRFHKISQVEVDIILFQDYVNL